MSTQSDIDIFIHTKSLNLNVLGPIHTQVSNPATSRRCSHALSPLTTAASMRSSSVNRMLRSWTAEPACASWCDGMDGARMTDSCGQNRSDRARDGQGRTHDAAGCALLDVRLWSRRSVVQHPRGLLCGQNSWVVFVCDGDRDGQAWGACDHPHVRQAVLTLLDQTYRFLFLSFF